MSFSLYSSKSDIECRFQHEIFDLLKYEHFETYSKILLVLYVMLNVKSRTQFFAERFTSLNSARFFTFNPYLRKIYGSNYSNFLLEIPIFWNIFFLKPDFPDPPLDCESVRVAIPLSCLVPHPICGRRYERSAGNVQLGKVSQKLGISEKNWKIT